MVVDLPPEDFVIGKKLGNNGLFTGDYRENLVVALRVDLDERDLSVYEVNSTIFNLNNLEHQNITTFVGVTRPTTREICFLVEYMEKGTLQAILASKEIKLSWTQRLKMAMNICSGLDFAWTTSPSNLFSELKTRIIFCKPDFSCKLNVLDYAFNWKGSAAPIKSFGCGDVVSMAPEVLKGKGKKSTHAAQIYALGIIFSEISTRQAPYQDIIDEKGYMMADMYIADQVSKGKLRPGMAPDTPPFFKEITEKCLAFDPKKRPDVNDVLELLIHGMASAGPGYVV